MTETSMQKTTLVQAQAGGNGLESPAALGRHLSLPHFLVALRLLVLPSTAQAALALCPPWPPPFAAEAAGPTSCRSGHVSWSPESLSQVPVLEATLTPSSY